jgi:hypothetical protein
MECDTPEHSGTKNYGVDADTKAGAAGTSVELRHPGLVPTTPFARFTLTYSQKIQRVNFLDC